MLRIKELIKEKGTTGKELAVLLGISQTAMTNITQGNSFPKPELLKEIARVLNVDIRELFHPTKLTKKEPIYIKRNDKFISIGEVNLHHVLELFKS